MTEMQRWQRVGGEGRKMQTYLHSSRDGRARTRASQRREALKGIRVEVCWRGRLFGTSDMSQWGPALGNPITATGGTEQRVGWERWGGWGGRVGGVGGGEMEETFE